MTFETEIEDENEVSQEIEVSCSITEPYSDTGIGYGVEDIEATTLEGDRIDLTVAQIDVVEAEALEYYFEREK